MQNELERCQQVLTDLWKSAGFSVSAIDTRKIYYDEAGLTKRCTYQYEGTIIKEWRNPHKNKSGHVIWHSRDKNVNEEPRKIMHMQY